MITEYYYETSRGATAMKFFDKEKAKAWYLNQKEKFGDAMPTMQLVKVETTVIKTYVSETN